MGIARGPNIIKDNLVFGYDTGYGVADNNTATRFYPGEPTVNLLDNSDDWSSNWTGNLFSNWVNATVTANAGVAPDGTTTASKLTGGYSRWQRINCSTSTTYTFSFWIKNIDLRIAPKIHIAFGLNGTLVNYNNTTSIALNTIDEWTRVSKTHTSPSSGINQMEVGVEWSANHPNTDSVLVWHAKCEQNSHMTPFAYKNNDRSSTQSLIDLKRTTDIDVSNVSFDSTGQPSFDETDDHITGTLPMNGLGAPHTIEMVFSCNVNQGSIGNRKDPFSIGNATTHQYSALDVNTGYMNWYFYSRDTTFTNSPLMVANKFYHIVLSYAGGSSNNTNKKVWFNGVQQTLSAGSPETPLLPNNPNFSVGRDRGRNTAYWPGEIPVWKVYQKAFTQEEAQQNYNAYKHRFNI